MEKGIDTRMPWGYLLYKKLYLQFYVNFVKIIGNRKGVMKMELKEKLITSVEKNLDTYMSYVQHMYDHPEIGNEEFETMELLSEGLLSFGFEYLFVSIIVLGFVGSFTM